MDAGKYHTQNSSADICILDVGAGMQNTSQCIQQWEYVLDKLKILDYESKFCKERNLQPFHRAYFIMQIGNPALQFQSFLEICSWLINISVGNDQLFAIDKYDDPTTIVQKIIIAMKNLNIEVNFPASHLKQPFGEAVVSVIDLLSDKALSKVGFIFLKPIHTNDELTERNQVDSDSDEGEVEEYIEEVIKEDLVDTSVDSAYEKVVSDDQYKAIEGQVDPVVWQQELERVRPKLTLREVLGMKDWRSHLEQTKSHEISLVNEIPEASCQLDVISSSIADMLAKLALKERYINSQNESLKEEFSQLNKCRLETSKKFKESRSNVTEMSARLSQISDQSEELKAQMNERGSKMSEASPLLMMKHSLQHIKDEIKTFDLQIGVVSHSLVAFKVRLNQGEVKKGRQKHNQGKSLKNREIIQTDDDTEGVPSDDDEAHFYE